MTPIPQLRCFVCEKVLSSSMGIIPQPSGGTSFSASGNYGSTLWDPINDDGWLQLSVCDDCLLARAHLVLHGHRQISRVPDPIYRSWTPGHGEDP